MTQIKQAGFSIKGASKRYIAIGLVAFLSAFSPTLWAIGWHLRHGNSVWFSGKQIHVPLRWIGTADYTEVSLTKLPCTLLLGTWRVGGVTVNKLPAQLAGDNDAKAVEDWYKVHSPLASDPSIVLVSRNEPNLTCIQASAKQFPGRVGLSCLAYPAMLHAEFIGSATDVPEYMEMARSLR